MVVFFKRKIKLPSLAIIKSLQIGLSMPRSKILVTSLSIVESSSDCFRELQNELIGTGRYADQQAFCVDYSTTNQAFFEENSHVVPYNIELIKECWRIKGYANSKVDIVGHSILCRFLRYIGIREKNILTLKELNLFLEQKIREKRREFIT